MTIAKEMINLLTHNELQVVGMAVKLGFTSGSIGKVEWELEVNKYDIYSNIMRDISREIEEGFTSGSVPEWELTYKRYTSIEFNEDDHYEGKLTI